MADNFIPVQAPKLFLSGSGVTSTATSVQVTSLYKPGTTTSIAMSAFGDTGYGTFEPGTAREENFSFTGITTASDGKATFTGVTRGLDFISPFAETTALKHAHAGGTAVYISNSAPFYAELGAKDSDESLTGTWTFSASAIPRLGSAGTWGSGTEEYFVTKRYADALAIAGAPDATTSAKGIVELATQAQVNAGTNAGDTTSASLAPTPGLVANAVQMGVWAYAVDAGANDTYAITLVPAPTAYAAGLDVTFDPNTSNTGAATLNVNALGAKDIKKYCNGAIAALETNDIIAGMPVHVTYDGTQFVMHTTPATSLDSATAYEAQQFFGATDITGAEAQTLTGGQTSDADALHTHPDFLMPIFLADQTNVSSSSVNNTHGAARFVGYSDATTKTLSVKSYNDSATPGPTFFVNYLFNSASGIPYMSARNSIASQENDGGCVLIGTDRWTINGAGGGTASTIFKNGSAVVVSGTAPTYAGAPLSHDPTNNYLLVNDATTRIRRYSGIAGTTITFVDSITLDNAVDHDSGFIYDNTNARYIMLDSAGTVIRRFNSAGTTLDTLTLDTGVPTPHGLCFINNRVWTVSVTGAGSIAASNNWNGSSNNIIEYHQLLLLPTTMTR